MKLSKLGKLILLAIRDRNSMPDAEHVYLAMTIEDMLRRNGTLVAKELNIEVAHE
jgi:hypothetical protein